ncbi:hypothetical protein KSP40_PGU000157 [Platanthera guangdongensis]|uniref:CASP-like protein n=1 Tax=Platanthera guangdongensis TaxID=2320717 RepID=A0ABR2LKF3_9ASPA
MEKRSRRGDSGTTARREKARRTIALLPHRKMARPKCLPAELRHLNILILILRFASFCFLLVAAVFMASNSSRSHDSHSWLHFPTFRYVLAANSIVAIYSLFEIRAAVREILKS